MALSNNSLAFIALCNEYCSEIENAQTAEPADFVAKITKLLPRIYIAATDVATSASEADGFIESSLEESDYDSVRRTMEALLGEHDTYLEVFENDMKYSDTPIGASVAEQLADLFQVFYNFLETVRNAPDELAEDALAAVSEDFRYYWGQILCNVMRPLNKIRYEL
jgi:hypothetical protein